MAPPITPKANPKPWVTLAALPTLLTLAALKDDTFLNAFVFYPINLIPSFPTVRDANPPRFLTFYKSATLL